MSRVKGSPKTGGRKKGSLNKETLTKMERRAVFDKQVSQKWEETIDKLPPTYVADQFMGVATQKVEHSGEIKTNPDIDIDLLADEMAKKLKEKKVWYV